MNPKMYIQTADVNNYLQSLLIITGSSLVSNRAAAGIHAVVS